MIPKKYSNHNIIILLLVLASALGNTGCSPYSYGAKNRGSSLIYWLNPFVRNVKKCKSMGAYGGKTKKKKVKGYEPPGGMKSLAGLNIPKFTPTTNSNPLPERSSAQPTPVVVAADDRLDKTIPPPDPKLTKEMVKNYKKLGLKPKKVLEPVYFETNSGKLDISQTAQFTDAEEYGIEGYIILVEGHTDDVGSTEYNDKLSLQRVRDVEDLLVATGVSPDNVSVIGHGEREPMVPNTSDANRRKNRRVQFKIF
jgi:outer membrane protein OmpA-like peptidoglycan-associated protein